MHDDDREIEGINMLSRFAERLKTIENMTRADSASFMKNARKCMHATVITQQTMDKLLSEPSTCNNDDGNEIETTEQNFEHTPSTSTDNPKS